MELAFGEGSEVAPAPAPMKMKKPSKLKQVRHDILNTPMCAPWHRTGEIRASLLRQSVTSGRRRGTLCETHVPAIDGG
jgi:hypothetical protein